MVGVSYFRWSDDSSRQGSSSIFEPLQLLSSRVVEQTKRELQCR